MKCGECGRTLTPSETHCGHCGAVVDASGGTPDQSRPSSSTGSTPSNHAPLLEREMRAAVGAREDYYLPRFVEFTRNGKTFPSWNWPALFVPVGWAAYRKLWGALLLFACLGVGAWALPALF